MFLASTIAVLIGMARRREGIAPVMRCAGGRGFVGDCAYAYFCCPLALSWLVRTETHVSAGHARSWNLLSPVGSDESSTEVHTI